eukprot:scpid105066/ scgid27327/ 
MVTNWVLQIARLSLRQPRQYTRECGCIFVALQVQKSMYYVRTVKMGEVVVAPLLDLVVWKCTCCVATCPYPALHVMYTWCGHAMSCLDTALHVMYTWCGHAMSCLDTALHVMYTWCGHAMSCLD